MSKLLSTLILLATISAKLSAQGPDLPFFYNQSTNLSWAEASIQFKSGSKSNIKFFPVNDIYRSPFGTNNYTENINVHSPLLYIHNINNIDSALHLKDKAILYCYDSEADIKNFPVKINALVSKKVSAIILFSKSNEYPFLKLWETSVNNEIPIVTLDKSSAKLTLSAMGYDAEELWSNLDSNTASQTLLPIVNLNLKVDGRFSLLSSKYSEIRFNKRTIDSSSIHKILLTNDSAMNFITSTFKEIVPKNSKTQTTYFSDYDEKLFFTSHWGKGLANEYGVYSVLIEINTDYPLAVHELTHIFFKHNLNGNISFLSEGIAMFAEAKSENSRKNNINTLAYLNKGQLLSLSELVKLDIGSDKNYTEMGYYASGSFVEFLIETQGQAKFIKFWQTNQEWERIYGLTLLRLEKEWHSWLKSRTKRI